MKHILYREQQLNCSLQTAWDFFSSPKNLSKITPKDMGFTVLTEHKTDKIFEGMIIDYTVSPLLGIPLKWKSRITEVVPNRSFTDFQEKGPYKLWNHFHEFTSNEKGVLMKDKVEYELPMGVLGNLAHTLFVKNKLEKIFNYRYHILEELFNSKKNEMKILIVLLVFILMEGATWIIHKYIMHGLLWILHKDHHDHSNEGAFEKNDYFFVIFALPTIALMYFGSLENFNYLFFIGLGIMLYGMAYFFVHDVFIHQRIKYFTYTKNPYFLALRRAHKQHHKHLGKEEGECFGFLYVPFKYFKMYFNSVEK